VGAGRTDRGVHAQGQIVSFGVQWKHELFELQRAMNAVLAADVAVAELGVAAEGFHPRFSARSRSYRYTVLNQPWRSALARRTAWHVTQPLDLAPMARACRCLIGTHDFAAFGDAVGARQVVPASPTVRTVYRAEWREERPWLLFEIVANAFLYRMVRTLVGTLILVGSGQMPVEEFETVLRAKDRSRVKHLAPAHGLCLMQVDYATCDEAVQPGQVAHPLEGAHQ
jgi:tRNA pseudouridine38-40 synthase